MRSRSPARWLFAAVALTACSASPAPAGPADGAPSASVAVPPAPAPTSASATEPRVSTSAETGCFAKPVTLADKRDKSGARQPRTAKPVDDGLPRKLAACAADTDPDACRATVAKVYFDANRFEDAGPILRDVALHGQTGVAAAQSAQLYLECLNVLGAEAEPPRAACFDDMARDVGALKSRHCATPRDETKVLCSALDRIEIDIARLRAEDLVKDADRDEEETSRRALYRKAGDTYMDLFEHHCAFHRPDAKSKAEPPPGWTPENRCDEIAYNAMRAYMAAHEKALAQRAQAALLEPLNRLDKGELAKKARTIDIR